MCERHRQMYGSEPTRQQAGSKITRPNGATYLASDPPVLSNDECRKRAQECIEKAQSAREPDKSKLLHLARCWLILADGGLPMLTDIPADDLSPAAK